MLFNTDLLLHIHSIRECMTSLGGRAVVDFETLKLELRAAGKRVEMLPQFVLRRDDRLAYTPRLGPDVNGFIGWRPYFNRVWPAAIDKAAFKEHCLSNGLPTPKRYMQFADVSAPVLIKRSRSSFGMGILGPFAPNVLRSSNRPLADVEFIEDFIHGTIAKAWYWNDAPAVIEVLAMPTVSGDGASTARELIQRKLRTSTNRAEAEWTAWTAVVEYQGIAMDQVVPEGKSVLVDYRYRSSLIPVSTRDRNVIDAPEYAQAKRQLIEAGPALWSAIPEQVRAGTMYSVDAIIDQSNKVWYLEMNCNPALHVDVYRCMCAAIFSDEPQIGPGARNTPLQPSATVH